MTFDPSAIDIVGRADTPDDIPAFVRLIADTLRAGREFAWIVESDAGAREVMFSIRRDGEVFKIRDAAGGHVGTFASVAAAIKEGLRMAERD